jgi:hypothetical protein
MFSDPLDSPSSDSKSFDEDDMYGSDSDVETISMKPSSNEQDRSPTGHMVCTLFCHRLGSSLYLMQDNDTSSELDSLEMDVKDLSIMVKALCEVQGIDVSAIDCETQSRFVGLHSSQNTSDISLEVGMSDEATDA